MFANYTDISTKNTVFCETNNIVHKNNLRDDNLVYLTIGRNYLFSCFSLLNSFYKVQYVLLCKKLYLLFISNFIFTMCVTCNNIFIHFNH